MHAATLVSSERTYTLNCKDNNQCHPNSSSSPLIGRSGESQESSSTKRDAPPCHECCSTPLCNKALCNHPRPTNCVDDPSVDCAKLDSIFNVCADIHKAKLVCPRFCNLCNVVDGNWNWWSSWSGCDVTCANGIQTRHRSCTDPAPKNGGLDCLGTGTESQSCIMEACPVHGGWSQWSPWGSCSVTCDIGMQRRDRSCDNPYPTKSGDHCFGDSRDDRICLTTGCTNGNWSAWENWSSCSASCGGGRKTRNRACNNPSPSLLGRYCDGPPQDVDVCNVSSCTGLDIVFVVGIPAIKGCVYNNSDGECRVEFRNYISRPNAQFDLQTATFTAANSGYYWFAWTFIGKWLSAYNNLKMTCYLNKNNASLSTILLDRI
ncbi:thrombospondin-1-like isoform X2 [Dreissena polymorpha]|nr:thrombospondin-1-like isoform X2 [Dreissena polymorpha]